jgi:hypothetical protein
MKFRPSKKQWLKPVAFVGAFAVVGIIMLFRSFAQDTSTISGYAFEDTNRNGVMDAGEAPRANDQLYLLTVDASKFLGTVLTDTQGHYVIEGLTDGSYLVMYEPSTWGAIKYEKVPTTTGSILPRITVNVLGQATANFGWRPITYSSDITKPISTYKTPNGLTIQSYTDALSGQDIAAELSKGSLVGNEGIDITVRFNAPGNNVNATTAGYQGGPGTSQPCSNYSAISYITYGAYLNDIDVFDGAATLFHEYGHAWSLYYACMVQNDPAFTGYVKARGLTGDSRLNSSYAWGVRELVAEDYRQLFGSIGAQARPQANTEIPNAKDVPGLKEYLSTTFLTGPGSGTPPAPSAPLTATATLSAEGPAVQLAWGASSGAASYEIYRNGAKIGSVNAPSTTYYDGNGLNYSTSYSYYIKPLSSTGTAGPASNTVTVTTPAQDTTAPTSPISLSSPSQTTNSINLSWSPSTDNVGVVGYRVYQIGGSRKNQFTTLLTTTTNTTYTVTGLTKGTSYSFYVTAIDAAGNESVPTRTLTVKTRR